MPDGTLHRYFLNNSKKPIYKWIHYFDIYERHFERYRNKSPVMIEIGVADGGSLEMWSQYFGSGSKIIGIDINPECAKHATSGIDIVTGNQRNPVLIDEIFRRNPRVDIVLDDGSHLMRDMTASFQLLYHRIHEEGIYIVEDLHTCYWGEYEGGLGAAGSFMEFIKEKLDEINAVHTRGAVPVSEFTKSTRSITCYDSVAVFEKRLQGARIDTRTMGM